ncbi:hypothetical protein [Streptomyces sp. NPDC002746]
MNVAARIEPGQVYRSCAPRGGPRIKGNAVYGNRADIADAPDGKRPRSNVLTAFARPRRTSDVLDAR